MSDPSNPADILLSRTPNPEYLHEWTGILQSDKGGAQERRDYSLLLFRIASEWFGLSTSVFNQVCEKKPIHSIPYRQNPMLLGLVNIGGQIRVCFAIDKLLGIAKEAGENESLSSVVYNRMVVIEKEGNTWVFPVDEVYGIFQFDAKKMENVPVNVAKSSSNFLKGVYNWKDRSIGFLDEDLLCYSLKTQV